MNTQTENLITDEELLLKIEDVISNYSGQLDTLNEVIGMVVVGRYLGYDIQRFVASRSCWSTLLKLFGDPKINKIMPSRTKYSRKSYGLKLVDKLGGYWDIIKGHKAMPMKDRKTLI